MTINITNLPLIDGEFVIKNLTIMKEGNVFSTVNFENAVITQEEQKIIKNFNFSVYYECGNPIFKNHNNLNFNSTTFNLHEKNHPEKDKTNNIINNNNNNNSIIYNHEMNVNNAYNNSNNDNIFNKNNSLSPNVISNNNNFANAISCTTNYINNIPNTGQSIKAFTNVNLNNFLNGTGTNANLMVNPKYSFFKIVVKNLKIMILKKQDILIAGFFSNYTSSCLIKGYLLHIYAFYYNYINEIFDTAKNKFKEGSLYSGILKQNLYFKDNSFSTSPIRDKRDFNSNVNHFIMTTQGNEKIAYGSSTSGFSNLQGNKNSSVNPNNLTNNNNNPANLVEIGNFINMMNKKIFEVFF